MSHCCDNIVTPINPCINSNPCTQITNAACVQYNGTLGCITTPNPTLDIALVSLCATLNTLAANQVFTTKVVLTAAQINSSGTTRVQVLPAPGVGKVIQILSVYNTYTYGTAAYFNGNSSSASFLGYGLSTGVSKAFQVYPGFILGSTNSQTLWTTVSIPDHVNSFINSPVYFLSDQSPTGSGDGTVSLYITYKIISI